MTKWELNLGTHRLIAGNNMKKKNKKIIGYWVKCSCLNNYKILPTRKQAKEVWHLGCTDRKIIKVEIKPL